MDRARGLFAKYALTLTVGVTLLVVASNLLATYLTTRESLQQLRVLQSEQARSAAARIQLYVEDIARQAAWVALPSTDTADLELVAQRLNFLKLLRQVPAATDLLWVDGRGREKLRVSRVSVDRANAGTEYSDAPWYREASGGSTYYGPVYFRKDTEPYMTIAQPLAQPGEGVFAMEVNLVFVRDVIARTTVGRGGLVFVTDTQGNLIAHPDMALVLQKTSYAGRPQFLRAANSMSNIGSSPGLLDAFVPNALGQPVLSAAAPVTPLRWLVFVELPRSEALEPLRRAALVSVAVLLGAVLLSVMASMLLARRLLRPIRLLQARAAAIGRGDLTQDIHLGTGDELEDLAQQFNEMAGQVRESYATLERRVERRTAEAIHHRTVAEKANAAKTRFLAAASHDLRQPLHALNLYVGSLARHELSAPVYRGLADIRECVEAMNRLLEAILDTSRLDARVVPHDLVNLPLAPLLERIRVEFAPMAAEKGLQLRIMPCRLTVCSNEVLLARIVSNLVSNAIRHSHRGQVLVGCRRRGGFVRLIVYDQGPGIPPEMQELVFDEFFQMDNAQRDRERGVGLGLAIVKRCAELLNAKVTLQSHVGRGSAFAVELPVATETGGGEWQPPADAAPLPLAGKVVLLVEDDLLAQRATCAVLHDWGCQVLLARSGAEAQELAASCTRVPDLMICDFRLPGPHNGVEVMELLREEFNCEIPSVLVTGELAVAEMPHIGYRVLRKPVTSSDLQEAIRIALASEPGKLQTR